MKILFVANRYNVLKTLLTGFVESKISIDLYVLADSYLEKQLKAYPEMKYHLFNLKDKKRILSLIYNCDYDIFISNGCPFIINTNKLKTNKPLINIHPTYLPNLRGKTPLNGVFYNNINHIGATVHFINNRIDQGNIIYQEKHPITNDLDLGLVYFLSFHLEGVVFKKAFQILLDNNFENVNTKQNHINGTYFNRKSEMMKIDFTLMDSKEILKRVKSFGILGQGCKTNISQIKKIYDIEVIINQYLLDVYKEEVPGTIVLRYDGKLLIKTIDGLIKLLRYE